MAPISFATLVTVCVSAHIIRTIYEILKHKKLLIPGRISFVVVFTDMLCLWASWVALCSLDPYKAKIAGLLFYPGILLACAGAFFFFTALFTIKSLESYEGDLVSRGIYSWIRHPMYLGFICWLVGFPLLFGALFSMLLAVVFIVNVMFWRYLEEEELVLRFPDYEEYRKTTLF